MSEPLRVLGIDPGSRLTGFGVLDFNGDKATYIASGGINCANGEFADRLKIIFRSVSEIVAEYRPSVVAIESVFVNRSAGSALKLGHARSAAICATFSFDVTVVEYSPREIKQAIVGSGAATKEQIQHMVKSLLSLGGEPSPDAADALAAAICYGHQRRMKNRLSDRQLLARRR
ncbi:MAG: crossover junction endodeoxyribonuclease RuvC [Gammaproteobacteria bacterium]|nr:crossover junction endodeoxyribonuclease RuvC [Gammaproteobacteria bacterium]MDH4313925.1 crossover junction endodeoxyribonuclease RuvC [Gammaproteobacteria bacterium]MDH5212999.1 crossover junction endodeoxyribonuclease RuvC [Gammaproteobacteria bacterium]